MMDFDDIDGNEIIKEGPPEKPLKHWRSLYESNNFKGCDLEQYFVKTTPKFAVIHPKNDPNDFGRFTFDDQSAKEIIIDTIEEFILGDNAKSLLENLKAEGKKETVCGKVFKVGEPTYSCRECGMDPTCVLCVDCFKQSAHRHHKYKMSTSLGSGCCDCGDVEAWKRDPFCDGHMSDSNSKDETSLITDRIKERCYPIFEGIMQFGVKTLEYDSEALHSSLSVMLAENVYCCVLYNDETHTFEQVISTLTRTIRCNQKDAIDLISNVDREGRAILKCSSFQTCMDLKIEVEKHSAGHMGVTGTKGQPLKVMVLHKTTVAAQEFAVQLLSWFQDFLSVHAVFRKIFADIILENTSYNLKHILLNDWKLWKTARAAWHHLLISSMLIEYENKKKLACVFTSLYPILMQDFTRDDHDHNCSIVSMSVQLFTVPSIAQHLIAHESAFYKLMHTFYSEAIEKHVKKKVIQFTKNNSNLHAFRRASYILYDLRYLLSFKPEVWNDQLRMNFLHGVQTLLKLLREMQGMDAVFRQTGQHMEFEPDWESAFNLHIKLAQVVTLVLDWCSSDKIVLVKVYRNLLRNLSESEFILANAIKETRECADHSASCFNYDVSSKYVSIHLPLSRFFAGVYLHLEKYNLDYRTAMGQDKPTLEIEEIIEPVLCTQTMMAQVHAGMWRRNGYALLHQLFFYRNVRCRAEMLDRDIVVLQIGASIIESNEFLIHVLNKFNLLNWLRPEFESEQLTNSSEEDSIRQLMNIIDEMLDLLIVIVGERYIPGVSRVTVEDKIKNEIIQQLCIKPFSHSELSHNLMDAQDNSMEHVIDSVAVFQKPNQSDKKGEYVLKDEFYDNYNMFFYHYTKEEKSKSEETQRKRREKLKQFVCCPPPKLPQLTENFAMIANLLQCDIMLLIIQTILKRAIDLKSKTFLESHLQKVLFLIGYGLQEEESGNYEFLVFQKKASTWGILTLLEELVKSQRVEAHRDFIIWTVKKFKDMQTIASGTSSSVELLPSTSSDEVNQQKKEERARLAAKRREMLLAQLKRDQNNFMSRNLEHFDTKPNSSTAEANSMEWREEMSEGQQEVRCLGPNRKFPTIEEESHYCILCSEESKVTKDGPCMVYSSFIQKSKVLTYPQDNKPLSHIGSCGHVLHDTCWQEYFDNEMNKESRRLMRVSRSPPEKKEFLCPLCRSLSNSAVPLVPSLSTFNSPIQSNDYFELNVFIDILKDMGMTFEQITKSADEDSEGSQTKLSSSDRDKLLSSICPPHRSDVISNSVKDMIGLFMKTVLNVAPYSQENLPEEVNTLYSTWTSCWYTIEALEMQLRSACKPMKEDNMSLRHKSCLSSLIRVCALGAVSLGETGVPLALFDCLLAELKYVFSHSSLPIIHYDIFSKLVTLIFLMPSVIHMSKQSYGVPNGNMMDYYLLKIMFAVNIAKILVLYDENNDPELYDDIDMDSTHDEMDQTGVVEFYQKFNMHLSQSKDKKSRLTRNKLLQVVRDGSDTFLRCSCLLFHFLTDVEFPDEFSSYIVEFDRMCLYLGLDKNIESYFSDPILVDIMKMVGSHPDIMKQNGTDKTLSVVPYSPPVRRLINLPQDYSDVINSVSIFSCPNNGRDESRNPTMCLICNKILCSMTYCCQQELDNKRVGACTYHADECGAGVGVFLRIRECEILILGVNKGCSVTPPYLDEYGETDQGLRRGNPLKLCYERYEKIQMLWLSHSLHEEIARTTDSNTMYTTPWGHF